MICPHCEAQNPESARFCSRCGVGLFDTCPNCQAPLQEGARYCMQCGLPVRQSTAADTDRMEKLVASAPQSLAEKIRASGLLTGERRNVTVLLADIVSSTTLSNQLSGDEWSSMANEVFARITPILYQYEGTIAQLLGDAVIAFFGAPVAHEDDPERAVRAGLEIIEAAQDLAKKYRDRFEVQFSMRVCINTGPIIIGAVSEDLHYDFRPIGDVINLAGRMKFSAEPMTVTISDKTHRFVAGGFETQPLELMEVKGRDLPIQIYKVLRQISQDHRGRGLIGLESPLVGRDGELDKLSRLLETVQAGLGRAVVVIGEPGVGKSRLIREWKASIEKRDYPAVTTWAVGHALSYGQDMAYHLVTHLLQSLLGLPSGPDEDQIIDMLKRRIGELYGMQASKMDMTQEEAYRYLAHLSGIRKERDAALELPVHDPQSLQARYLEVLRGYLKTIASEGPVVLVLEDIHWADPSSVELLSRLLPLTNSIPILFCMVTRPDRDTHGWNLIMEARELIGDGLAEIELQPLGDVYSRELVANLLRVEAIPEKTRDLILEKSEGNPLFVEEVLRMLIDQEVLYKEGDIWRAEDEIDEVEIPNNLEGLLLARIDRLPEDWKYTLKVASVIGRRFPVRLLEQVVQRELAT